MEHSKHEQNSPPRGYYVQSPRDSQEDASAYPYHHQSTLPYNNFPAMDSPLNRSSYARTSNYRSSSASWISSHWRWYKKRNSKKWQEPRVIQQSNLVNSDGHGTSYNSHGMDPRRSYFCILLMVFAIVFSVFCLIVWGITRTYETQVRIMSLTVDDFHFGQGSDRTGVPTKFVTVNCTTTMSIRNPARFFGIYIRSKQVDLIMYSEIKVASGELKKYFQPRGSSRIMSVNLNGRDIPLYGAASMLPGADGSTEVPLKLEIEVQSRGYIIGKLIKRKHTSQSSCSLLVKPWETKEFKFQNDSCVFD